MTATVINLKASARIRCSACGISVDAGCDCGAAYIPAGKLAAEAVARNPEKSDRAIAAELGVGRETVRRARTAPNGAVDQLRVGLDGKVRKQPTPKPKMEKRQLASGVIVEEPEDMPTEAEAEESHQATLYDQGCLIVEQMSDETRRRFFAHIKRKYQLNRVPEPKRDLPQIDLPPIDPVQARIRGFLYHAEEAQYFAEEDGLKGLEITDEIAETAAATASAWHELTLRLMKGSKM